MPLTSRIAFGPAIEAWICDVALDCISVRGDMLSTMACAVTCQSAVGGVGIVMYHDRSFTYSS